MELDDRAMWIKNTVGVQSSYNWVFTCGVTYTGNAIYGFTTAFAAMKPTVPNTCANTLDQLTVNGGGNFTDAQSGSSPDGTWFGGPPATHAYTHPGTTYNVPGSSAFVAYPGNYRISQSSALYGAGRAIGDVDLCISFAGWHNPGGSGIPPVTCIPMLSMSLGMRDRNPADTMLVQLNSPNDSIVRRPQANPNIS